MQFLKNAEKISKKFVLILGMIILAILFISNFFYTSTVENFAEHVAIDFTTSVEFVISIASAISAILIIKKIKINKMVIVIGLICYVFISIKWINKANVEPIDDSLTVNNLAISLVQGGIQELKNNEYIEKCPHQIGMIAIFAGFYKIFRTTDYHLIQFINIVANLFTILGMYAIIKKTKKNFSEIGYFLMIMTFIPLILLTTYVYGDYIGLAMAVWGIYFIINYEQKNKIGYMIISAIFMCFAYIAKMNYIIYTIAIACYMFLYVLNEKEKKMAFLKSIVIIVYLIIAIIPFNIGKSYICQELGCEPKQALPTSMYIYMGMSESSREAGWYSEVAEAAWDDTVSAYQTYPKLIKQRVKEFIKKPIYTCKFYARKIISGWSDPYFQSIWYNVGVENKDEKMLRILSGRKFEICKIYQKTILILIFGGAIYAFYQNRKQLNNEMILFLIILIGGFLFHILWEMKSRYVMPYVIILIPIASIGIEEIVNILEKSRLEKGRK